MPRVSPTTQQVLKAQDAQSVLQYALSGTSSPKQRAASLARQAVLQEFASLREAWISGTVPTGYNRESGRYIRSAQSEVAQLSGDDRVVSQTLLNDDYALSLEVQALREAWATVLTTLSGLYIPKAAFTVAGSLLVGAGPSLYTEFPTLAGTLNVHTTTAGVHNWSPSSVNGPTVSGAFIRTAADGYLSDDMLDPDDIVLDRLRFAGALRQIQGSLSLHDIIFPTTTGGTTRVSDNGGGGTFHVDFSAIRLASLTGFIKGATGVLSASASIVGSDVASSLRRRKLVYYSSSPAVNDVHVIGALHTACTIKEAYGICASATSWTIQVKKRARTAPFSAGTDLLTSALACTTSGASTTSFAVSSISDDDEVFVEITAKSGTPGALIVEVEYEVD